MVEKKFTRETVIIGLGGGVVGDIAGLTASLFMRGIPIIQIPTTLLAMVDSSIGGKTGVNIHGGKNIIGTFNIPKTVFIDPYMLKTLSKKHIKNGLAEIIKYGIIKSPKLFSSIEKNLEKIMEIDTEILSKIIKECIKIKEEIVKKDPTERKIRKILNFGHTFGHVIEKKSNYTLLHGFAIALGMTLASQKAEQKGLLKTKDLIRIKNLLKKAGLPVYTMNKPTLEEMATDKKTTTDNSSKSRFVNLILPTKIGEVIIQKEKTK